MHTSRGFGLVEVVVGAAILSVAFVGLAAAFQLALQVNRDTLHNLQAHFLLEEGVEVMRLLRDQSWENISTLSTTTSYSIVFENGTWATSTDEMFISNMFKRTVTIEDVYRDSTDDITQNGGTYDPGTRKVSVSIARSDGMATTTKQWTRTLLIYLNDEIYVRTTRIYTF